MKGKVIALLLLLTPMAWGDYYVTVSETKTAGSYALGTNWATPANVTGAGDNACSRYANNGQNPLVLYNFSFGGPSTGDLIDSINIVFDAFGVQSTPTRRQIEYQMTKTGGAANTGVGTLFEGITFIQASACSGTGNTTVSGNGLHGTTWTPAEVTASTFGLIIKDNDATAHAISLDAVTVTVWYDSLVSVNEVPTAPTPSLPNNGAVNQSVTPTLVVTNATDGDADPLTYSFQVATDSNFVAIVADTTEVDSGATTTSWEVDPELNNSVVYYWRARANDGTQDGAYSAIWSFTTEGQSVGGIYYDTIGKDGSSGDTTEIIDASIDNDYPFNNFGGGGLYVTNTGTHFRSSLIRPLNLNWGAGAECRRATLHIRTNLIVTDPGRVRLYPVLRDWTEGNSATVGAGRREGGPGYYNAKQPFYPDTIPSSQLPVSFDWRDSNVTTTVDYQGGCGSCFVHAATAAAQAAHKHGLPYDWDDNEDNGDGADRDISPWMDSLTITTAGTYNLNVAPNLLNYWLSEKRNDCGIAIVASSGDFVFGSSEAPGDSVIWTVTFGCGDPTALDDSVKIDSVRLIQDTYIKSGADSTTNFGDADSLRIKATEAIAIVRLDSLLDILVDSCGDVVVGSVLSSRITLKCRRVNTAGRIGAFSMWKRWVENEATWVNWKTGYHWGISGAGKFNELDFAPRQLLACVPGEDCEGGDPGVCYDYWDTTEIIMEPDFPYLPNDTSTCPDIDDFTTVGTIGWFWPIGAGVTQTQVKQAVLYSPITVSIDVKANYLTFVGTGCYSGNDPFYGTHAVVIQGWDSLLCGGVKQFCWLIQNSWGIGWGDDGFAYIIDSIVNIGSYSYLPSWKDSGIAWGTPGMSHAGGDYDSTTYVEVEITTGNTNYEFEIPPAWMDKVADGIYYGFVLRGQASLPGHGSDPVDVLFSSSESLTQPAYFTVEYSYPKYVLKNGVTIKGSGTNGVTIK